MMRVEQASRSAALPSLAGKRALVLINSDQGGGVEQLADDLIADLKNLGAAVRRDCLYARPQLAPLAKLSAIARCGRRVLAYAPDMTITFQPTASLVASVCGRLRGCPVRIVHQSNVLSDMHPVLAFLDRVAGRLGFYTVVIANSRTTQAAFAAYPSSYVRRLRRIDHGIPNARSARTRAATRAAHAIPADDAVILCCSRLVEGKGLDILVSALPAISGARLVIAGSGPGEDGLRTLAKGLGVENRIHFLGKVARSEVFDLCAASDVFAFPSYSETFGLAVVEAAMQGVPVVCRDLDVMREVLGDEHANIGEFVRGSNPETWAAAINKTLLCAVAKQRAAAFAPVLERKYSKERMLQDYRCLYSEVVCQRAWRREPAGAA